MADLDALLEGSPFALDHAAKAALFATQMGERTRHHQAHCDAYARILQALDFDPAQDRANLADYPFLPARLFKLHDLQSIPDEMVRKQLTSSGTSSQRPSRIFLDADAASLQTKVLTRIVGDFIGKKRLPMLVIDAASTVKNRNAFSARAAGILGFSMFGRSPAYALDDDLQPDWPAIDAFIAALNGGPALLFGFTFVVFQHFIQALLQSGRQVDLSGGVLIHGGGWKKLADRAVNSPTFKSMLKDATGIERCHNYYGLVEQTGSIFMECESGHLHCSVFSDVVIRDADFQALPQGARGLVQLASLLPRSYPGHNLLTEDEGTVLGEDDCPCGRKGRYFQIHGRTAQAEIRGCSDAVSP